MQLISLKKPNRTSSLHKNWVEGEVVGSYQCVCNLPTKKFFKTKAYDREIQRGGEVGSFCDGGAAQSLINLFIFHRWQ